MILGRLADTAENGGRQIMLNGHELSIEGHGAATFSDIASADARGEIAWSEPAFRTWVVKRAGEDGWVAGPAVAPPAAAPEEAAVATAPDEPAAAVTPDEPAADVAPLEAPPAPAVRKPADVRRSPDPPTRPARRRPAAESPESARTPKPVAAVKAAPAPKQADAAMPARSREGKRMMSAGTKITIGVVALLVLAAAVASTLGTPNPYTPVSVSAPAENTAP